MRKERRIFIPVPVTSIGMPAAESNHRQQRVRKQQQRFRGQKGFTQTDYIIAIGIFIVIFGLVVLYVTNYLANLRETAKFTATTNNAFSLLSIADFNETPTGWPELKANSSTALLMHFSENSSAAMDYSANGNNGSIVNGTIFNMTGKFGSALTFDSIDDFVNITDGTSSSFDISNGITLEAWVRPINSTQTQMIISKDTSSGSYFLALSGNRAYFAFYNGSTLYENLGSLTVQNSTFTHVAATYNGTHSMTYVNGTLDVTNTTTGQTMNINNEEVQIGARGRAPRNFFNGSIDEIAVYNVTLSAADILNHSAYERRLDKIGLKSRAYRFLVKVNNSKAYWYNQSASHATLTNEIVSVNLNNILTQYNINSTTIYDSSNNTVSYRIDGTNVSFAVSSIGANATQWYMIYADDDGIFANLSKAITGTDNMSETVIGPEEISVLDNLKLAALNASSYNLTRNATGFANFRIRLYDINSTSNYIQIGDAPPRRGDIVALQRYFIYQNSTGGIRPGRITVQTW